MTATTLTSPALDGATAMRTVLAHVADILHRPADGGLFLAIPIEVGRDFVQHSDAVSTPAARATMFHNGHTVIWWDDPTPEPAPARGTVCPNCRIAPSSPGGLWFRVSATDRRQCCESCTDELGKLAGER